MAEAKKDAPKQYKVTIHSGEDAGDKGDVVLAHNFRQVLIQRDQEVILDECFIDVLNNTKIETTIKDENGQVRAVKLARFSFSVSPA